MLTGVPVPQPVRDVVKLLSSIGRRAAQNAGRAVDTGYGGGADRSVEVVRHARRAALAAADLQALAAAYALSCDPPPTAALAAATDVPHERVTELRDQATADAMSELLSDAPDIGVIRTGLPTLSVKELTKIDGVVGAAAHAVLRAEAGLARPPLAKVSRSSAPGSTAGHLCRSWSRLVVGIQAELRHKRTGDRLRVQVARVLPPVPGRKRGLTDDAAREYREADWDIAFELPARLERRRRVPTAP